MTFGELYKTVVLECADLPIGEIETGLRQFGSIRKTEMATTARLLAAGRKLLPKDQWKDWAMSHSGLTRSECYHRAKAGDLLIAFQEKKVLYRKLIQLSGDKLLALAQLPLDVVEGFLAVTDIWKMKLAEVRIEVKCGLCRIGKRALGQTPDCEHCPFRLMREGKAATGFSDALEIIWNMDPESFLSGVKDDASATKCAGNGVNLLAAALEYEKGRMRENPEAGVNTAKLLQIKAALLDGIRDIEMLIAGELEKEDHDEISQSCTGIIPETTNPPECGTDTNPKQPDRSGELCCHHTDSDPLRGSDGSGDQCCSHTDKECCRHTDSECCSHTGSECERAGNGEQTVCHSGQKPDHGIRGSAGGGQSGGEGANEIHPVYPGKEDAGAEDSGSSGCHEGCAGPGGRVSDPSGKRTARKIPVDISELPKLDETDPGIPERPRKRLR